MRNWRTVAGTDAGSAGWSVAGKVGYFHQIQPGAGIDDRNGRGRTGTDGDHFLDIDITVSAGYCNRLEAGGCLYIAGEIPVIQLLSNAPVS